MVDLVYLLLKLRTSDYTVSSRTKKILQRAIVLRLLAGITLSSQETAYCVDNGRDWPTRLGENSTDEIESGFQLMLLEMLTAIPNEEAPIPIQFHNYSLNKFLSEYKYTGGRPVSFKLYELISIRLIPQLTLLANGDMPGIYIDTIHTRPRLIHLSRYSVGDCTTRVNANTIIVEGTPLNFRSYGLVPKRFRSGNSVIPNSHLVDSNNGYGLGGCTAKPHRRRSIFFLGFRLQ